MGNFYLRQSHHKSRKKWGWVAGWSLYQVRLVNENGNSESIWGSEHMLFLWTLGQTTWSIPTSSNTGISATVNKGFSQSRFQKTVMGRRSIYHWQPWYHFSRQWKDAVALTIWKQMETCLLVRFYTKQQTFGFGDPIRIMLVSSSAVGIKKW
jgi:hypothetical protein